MQIKVPLRNSLFRRKPSKRYHIGIMITGRSTTELYRRMPVGKGLGVI